MSYNKDIDLVLPCYNPPPGWEQKVINIQTVNTRIREGIAISDMGIKVLKQEVSNFLSILFNR